MPEHISHVFRRVLAEPKLVEIVSGIVRNGDLPNEAADLDYQGGANRLALAGFGGSLEAALIDLLSRQDQPTLAAAIAKARCNFTRYERPTKPLTWTLNNLIKVSRSVSGRGELEVPQALREWRNLIHPAVCLENYALDEALNPEVRVAAGLHEMVLRDLP